MILDEAENVLDSLAITACPADSQIAENCMLRDDGTYMGSCIATCRACWWKYLSKESECFHE